MVINNITELKQIEQRKRKYRKDQQAKKERLDDGKNYKLKVS